MIFFFNLPSTNGIIIVAWLGNGVWMAAESGASVQTPRSEGSSDEIKIAKTYRAHWVKSHHRNDWITSKLRRRRTSAIGLNREPKTRTRVRLWRDSKAKIAMTIVGGKHQTIDPKPCDRPPNAYRPLKKTKPRRDDTFFFF